MSWLCGEIDAIGRAGCLPPPRLFLSVGGVALSRLQYGREARAVAGQRGRHAVLSYRGATFVDTLSFLCKLPR
jgi:hypothetical protein